MFKRYIKLMVKEKIYLFKNEWLDSRVFDLTTEENIEDFVLSLNFYFTKKYNLLEKLE